MGGVSQSFTCGGQVLVVVAILLAAGWAVYRYSFRIESRAWVNALCRGKGGRRKVAITFDDGHHPIYTPKVLEVLKRHGVKACFFLIGDEIRPEILTQQHAEGHIVGNHTLHHRGMGPFASTAEMVRDAEACDRKIESVIGLRPQLFRPPFGVTNPMIGRMIKRRGYTTIGWSVRSLDTLGQPREKVLKRIEEQLHDGAIILLHDNREGAAELLDEVLRLLGKADYEVCRVDELLNIKAYKNEI